MKPSSNDTRVTLPVLPQTTPRAQAQQPVRTLFGGPFFVSPDGRVMAGVPPPLPAQAQRQQTSFAQQWPDQPSQGIPGYGHPQQAVPQNMFMPPGGNGGGIKRTRVEESGDNSDIPLLQRRRWATNPLPLVQAQMAQDPVARGQMQMPASTAQSQTFAVPGRLRIRIDLPVSRPLQPSISSMVEEIVKKLANDPRASLDDQSLHLMRDQVLANADLDKRGGLHHFLDSMEVLSRFRPIVDAGNGFRVAGTLERLVEMAERCQQRRSTQWVNEGTFWTEVLQMLSQPYMAPLREALADALNHTMRLHQQGMLAPSTAALVASLPRTLRWMLRHPHPQLRPQAQPVQPQPVPNVGEVTGPRGLSIRPQNMSNPAQRLPAPPPEPELRLQFYKENPTRLSNLSVQTLRNDTLSKMPLETPDGMQRMFAQLQNIATLPSLAELNVSAGDCVFNLFTRLITHAKACDLHKSAQWRNAGAFWNDVLAEISKPEMAAVRLGLSQRMKKELTRGHGVPRTMIEALSQPQPSQQPRPQLVSPDQSRQGRAYRLDDEEVVERSSPAQASDVKPETDGYAASTPETPWLASLLPVGGRQVTMPSTPLYFGDSESPPLSPGPIAPGPDSSDYSTEEEEVAPARPLQRPAQPALTPEQNSLLEAITSQRFDAVKAALDLPGAWSLEAQDLAEVMRNSSNSTATDSILQYVRSKKV